MLNRVVIIGRLTKDPESRYTANGNATCSFTLACDRQMKNAQGEKETDFLNINVPPYKAKLAELCVQYLGKGKIAAIDGSIQTRSYEGQDGKKVYITEIIAENVRFLNPKDEQVVPPAQQPAQNTAPAYTPPPYGAPSQQYGQTPTQPPYPGTQWQAQDQPPAQGYPQYPPGTPPSYGQQQYGYPSGAPQSQQGFWSPQTPPGAAPGPNQFGQQPPLQNHPGQAPFDMSKIGKQVPLSDDIPF